MDKVRAMVRAVSFFLVFKSMVGLSVAALAIFGVVVPYLGMTPAHVADGGVAAAGIGGLIGAILALRS